MIGNAGGQLKGEWMEKRTLLVSGQTEQRANAVLGLGAEINSRDTIIILDGGIGTFGEQVTERIEKVSGADFQCGGRPSHVRDDVGVPSFHGPVKR